MLLASGRAQSSVVVLHFWRVRARYLVVDIDVLIPILLLPDSPFTSLIVLSYFAFIHFQISD